MAERVTGGPYADAGRYEFRPAVRLLEQVARRRAAPGAPPPVSPGEPGPIEAQAVRFASTVDLAFARGSVDSVERGVASGGADRLRVNFLGLAGEHGPLPQVVTELLIDRAARGDSGPSDFLDILNDRLLAVFYRARRKHQPMLTPDLPDRGPWALYLKALLGLATGGLDGRLDDGRHRVPDRALLKYAGLINRQPRSQAGLAGLLADYLDVPVRVRPLVGRWQRLPGEVHTRLGVRLGQNAMLGRSAVLGRRTWEQDGKLAVELGPLAPGRLADFLPGAAGFGELQLLAGLYLDRRLEVDVTLQPGPDLALPDDRRVRPRTQTFPAPNVPPPTVRPLTDSHLPAAPQVRVSARDGARLGWTSYLKTRASAGDHAPVRLTVHSDAWRARLEELR
jgi:type VI secretion system protein ImpH